MKALLTIAFFFLVMIAPAQDKIFRAGNAFNYAIGYSNRDIFVQDTIRMEITGKGWKAAPETSREMVIHYSFAHIDTSIFRRIPDIGWVHTDTTGAVENEKSCWIHPPRHNQYRILELAPFPRIDYPLEEGRRYKKILFISDGWGDLSNTKVYWNYNIHSCKDGIWHISATAEPTVTPGAINSLDFTFSVNQGFLTMDYRFQDGTRIIMKQF
ncbi:hypothetical protein [Lentimicrobium sp.]|uniref:hypothetical protein n=1 Tax=Lentimicrobium sp. TaxID=2034841 RepID=UPI00345EBC02